MCVCVWVGGGLYIRGAVFGVVEAHPAARSCLQPGARHTPCWPRFPSRPGRLARPLLPAADTLPAVDPSSFPDVEDKIIYGVDIGRLQWELVQRGVDAKEVILWHVSAMRPQFSGSEQPLAASDTATAAAYGAKVGGKAAPAPAPAPI